MLNNKSVGLVISAYNEETQIKKVLEEIPDFVDIVVVINDGSKDKTEQIVKDFIQKDKHLPSASFKEPKLPSLPMETGYTKADVVAHKMLQKEVNPSNLVFFNQDLKKGRIVLITHKKNNGKGSAVVTGYGYLRSLRVSCVVTMDGDGQMDPSEMASLCLPIVNGEVDYVKGNRLSHRSAYLVIPKIRYFGNSILSLLTKIASGYWRISDTQCGYSAISLDALSALRLNKVYKSYGYINDILVKLNIAFFKIKEVPSKPVYNIGEKSKMKPIKVMFFLSFLLIKLFFERLYFKYLFRDFHPLFLFYHMGMALSIMSIPFGIQILKAIPLGYVTAWQYYAAFGVLFLIGFQSLVFAMWMDMLDNEKFQL